MDAPTKTRPTLDDIRSAADRIKGAVIRTPMIDGLDADNMAAGQPIDRVGEPAEVTAMLLFVIRDATYSTGHEFIVDGGVIIGSIQAVGPAD